MKRIIYIIPILILGIFGCKKKDAPFETDQEILSSWNYSSESYLKDSTLYFTKLLSLWQNNIVPSQVNDILDSIKVRRITKDYDKAENVLEYLINMTPKDPETGDPYDRFSFLDRQGVVNEEIQNARSTSYGIYVIYLQTAEAKRDNDNAHLYVRMLDLNSPAYIAGLRRGDRILSINGDTKYDYNTQKAQNFRGINDALNSASMDIKWQKPNGETFEKTIIQTQYTINPILSNWIKEIGGKKVGYFAFSSFISIVSQNQLNSLYNNLQSMFNSFETQGVKHLIVDLRYNGGGSTFTAEYLANKLAPRTANGKRMYYYKLNDVVKEELGSDFEPVDFSKNGNLELTKVYFLVTSSTASASELLINSLKPYMDVQIIGSEKTYGKPVGFWGIPIGQKSNKADIYVTSFQMFNAANFGDYFGGLAPNKITREDFLKDFGDVEEGFIAEALYNIQNGSYTSATQSALSPSNSQRVNNTYNIKTINTRASDIGMFKFRNKSLNWKD